MTIHGATKVDNKKKLETDPSAPPPAGLFDPCFMGSLGPALPIIAENKVKIAVNAGASDAELLAREVVAAVKELGLDLKVAWIDGDEVMDAVKALMNKGNSFQSLIDGRNLDEWGHEPVTAQ
jgi:hypothetical protein